jgi:imidazole glycerol-phosphate synthase subunit HisF
MLKKRIGAAILIKDNWVVQSIGFKKYLPVGRPQIAVEFLNKWGIDEIFLVDISATKNKTSVSSAVVRESARYCRVPLAAGGGITTVQQMEELLHSGADKISLNQVLLTHKKLLTQGARLFGDQCMVAMIDFVQNRSNGSYEVFDYVGNRSTGRDVLSFVKELEDVGAGEIVLQSVERDGMYTGFEIELYKQVCSTVNIPVVALGGAGNASHFNDILQNTDVSCACAGNIFHFTEHSVNMLKAQLVKTEKPIRLETGAAYQHNNFDTRGRLQKANDQYLEDLLFIRIEKEVI